MDTQTAFLMLATFTTGLVLGRLTMAIQYEVMKTAAKTGKFKATPLARPTVFKPKAPSLDKTVRILP